MKNKRSFVFGSNSLAVAAKILCSKPIEFKQNAEADRAIEDVAATYEAIRKASIVSPEIARTQISI